MTNSPPNQNRSFDWIFWILIVLLAPYLFLMLLNSESFPPRWYELRAQRQKMEARVQSAGGYEMLRRECMAFAQTNEMVHWFRWHTNDSPVLPPAISSLQPLQVDYVSPKLLGPHSDEPSFPIVRIKIFGMHSTGGHSTPFFGLEVVATPSSENYTPKARPAASGNGHLGYQKVSDGVYEIY